MKTVCFTFASAGRDDSRNRFPSCIKFLCINGKLAADSDSFNGKGQHNTSHHTITHTITPQHITPHNTIILTITLHHTTSQLISSHYNTSHHTPP